MSTSTTSDNYELPVIFKHRDAPPRYIDQRHIFRPERYELHELQDTTTYTQEPQQYQTFREYFGKRRYDIILGLVATFLILLILLLIIFVMFYLLGIFLGM